MLDVYSFFLLLLFGAKLFTELVFLFLRTIAIVKEMANAHLLMWWIRANRSSRCMLGAFDGMGASDGLPFVTLGG